MAGRGPEREFQFIALSTPNDGPPDPRFEMNSRTDASSIQADAGGRMQQACTAIRIIRWMLRYVAANELPEANLSHRSRSWKAQESAEGAGTQEVPWRWRPTDKTPRCSR